MSQEMTPLRVAIAGCGNIAQAYYAAIGEHTAELELVGAFDIDASRATALLGDSGKKVYATLDELLADDGVDVVVNLTIHQAHVEVITRALEAGKHVYTEKPLALDPADAQRMAELAAARGLRLASAPITFLGDAQQELMRLVREEVVGKPRMVYADMNWNRIESWHPAPQGFYAVGAMFDVGVYPLTILTALFGSVVRVKAFGDKLMPERVTTGGETFTIGTQDWICALLEFENGVRCRLTTSFYTGPSRQVGIEVHCDDGTLHLESTSGFDSALHVAPKRGDWEAQTVNASYAGVDWARGLADMAVAIHTGVAHQATAARAAHVVEIAAAAHRALESGETVELTSRAE